ncbi:PIG-L deacetylase family protein [Zavarzinella formosa]|uniref:PIG-L deacetylase family protein n=1 Tax=Zavarzinella formosa TaxID=360055 RepID=UPI0002F8B9B2|nr:PIG-L deacetylase family protein [Zavarzinella formosa]
MSFGFKNVLAFFAHPDDETLAAGATMNRLSREGATVHVAISSTGIHSRRNVIDQATRDQTLPLLRADCVKALGMIGVLPPNVYLGEFSDNEMDRHTLLELIHWLEEILAKVRPDAIFTHHRYCTNIDHQYCHEAAVVATRPSVNSHIPVFCGEIPSSTGYLKPTHWDPNFFVNVEAADVEAKIRAMQTYKEEARPDPHPRSPEVLRALAKVRGSEAGYFFAEAFMIQKLFA